MVVMALVKGGIDWGLIATNAIAQPITNSTIRHIAPTTGITVAVL